MCTYTYQACAYCRQMFVNNDALELTQEVMLLPNSYNYILLDDCSSHLHKRVHGSWLLKLRYSVAPQLPAHNIIQANII